MDFTRSRSLQSRSQAIIPGGCHCYAKGEDQYPEDAPAFIVRGKGSHVWDMDSNEFIEYGMGLRAVTLGHAFEPVLEAAHRQMLLGCSFTRPAPIEVECGEMLLDLIAGAEMVKFAKNGSDVTTAAVKLARAYTGRDLVAICADHPFFSVDDWFIGSTEMSAGIPEATKQLTVQFSYNNPESVRSLFDQYPGQIACLIMEVERIEPPEKGFLSEVQELCRRNGTLFVLDEIITGFRWHLGGAQACYGLDPDLSAFGKGMANGFSVSALVGKKEIMELGGIRHDKERVFLLSATYGSENHSLAAALETMRIYQRDQVVEHLHLQGEKLKRGIELAIEENKLRGYFEVVGRPCNLIYVTRDADKVPSQAFRTLFLQETIKRGLLMPSLVVSYSHTDDDIERTVTAISEALAVYRRALEEGYEKYLIGRPVKPVFRKFS